MTAQTPPSSYQAAIAFYRAGRIPDALVAMSRAVQEKPGDAGRWCDLGVMLKAARRFQEAVKAYEKAISLRPDFAIAWYNCGNALRDGGNTSGAIGCFRKALSIDDTLAGAWNALGLLLQQVHREAEEAEAALRRALALEPAQEDALGNLAVLLEREGRRGEAAPVWTALIARRDTTGTRLRSLLTLPPINRSRGAIQEVRAQLKSRLDALEAGPVAIADPYGEAEFTTFYTAYHGVCNRDLHAQIARIVARACPSLAARAPHVDVPRRTGERIRVGFVSRFMHRHSIGRTTRGLVDRLDKTRFETVVLPIEPLVDDDIATAIRSAADRTVPVPRNLARAREIIAALKLDVLFFQDIGMEAFTYFLAFSRLARVQCVSFGHPDTTGIPAMDYFVSNSFFERADAASDYSEKLFLLNDLGTLAYYYRPVAVPGDPAGMRALFPAGARIYLCPQTLFKLHPDFDEILRAILRKDPQAHVALIDQGPAVWSGQVRERIVGQYPRLASRLHFIPRQPGDAFLTLLAAADVILDPTFFNGMNTSLQAFSVGAPVVTLPTPLHRGRHTHGMYRRMEIDACTARDPADYVRRAVDLARNRDQREAVSALIRERNGVLYEDPRVVSEFERFFETSVAAAG